MFFAQVDIFPPNSQVVETRPACTAEQEREFFRKERERLRRQARRQREVVAAGEEFTVLDEEDPVNPCDVDEVEDIRDRPLRRRDFPLIWDPPDRSVGQRRGSFYGR